MCRYLYLYTIIYTYMSLHNIYIYTIINIYIYIIQIEIYLSIYIYLFVTHACTMTYVSCVQFESKCGSCNNLCSLATVGKRPTYSRLWQCGKRKCVQFESKCGSCNNLCSLATVGKRPTYSRLWQCETPVWGQRRGLLSLLKWSEMESKSFATASKDCSAHIACLLAPQYKQFSSQSLPRACTCRSPATSEAQNI